MLHSLCTHDDDAKSEGNQPEFVSLLQTLNLENLWDQLNNCLKTVSILEGIANGVPEINADGEEEGDTADMLGEEKPKQLQNSVAGLITRFLPAIEAFFIVNASSASEENEPGTIIEEAPDDDCRVVQFAASNKILLNALVRRKYVTAIRSQIF